MAKKLTEEERQTWTQEFLKMDTDGNAWLSRNELKRGIKKLYGKKFTDVEMEQFFRLVDSNEDGKIQLNEFLDAIGYSKKKE